MKLCKDCRHFERTGGVLLPGASQVSPIRCARAAQGAIDPVTGEVAAIPSHPSLCRAGELLCGREARWFEPVVTLEVVE